MPTLPLRHDPYAVFRTGSTPPALYARQKWLGQASDPAWRSDFDAVVEDLYQGQSQDGLWKASALETIHRLFGLHLTVRHADAHINAALDRLLETASGSNPERPDDVIEPARLMGLPFAPSRRHALVVPAVLFLASIFGREADPAVLHLYEHMASDTTPDRTAELEPAVLHNRLRALVVHPVYAGHEATRTMVDWLARRQTPQGDWGDDIPFFQAINALAHLESLKAEAQCRKAFDRLVKTQNPDGSWGRTEPVWSTFLAIHALRNRGVLPA